MLSSSCAFTALFLGVVLPAAGEGGPVFRVAFDEDVRAEPATGRVVVYLIREGAAVPPGSAPSDGPFWNDPQPMYGVDVAGLRAGEVALVGAEATAFPVPLSELPPGRYAAQAVLDVNRQCSDWRREAGNLYSDVARFEVGGLGSPVDLRLSHVVEPAPFPAAPGVELFEVRSELLSAFHGREVRLRAGVVTPENHDPARRYPAVYEVPGFGGDHAGAAEHAAARRGAEAGSAEAQLAERAFWIVLDPEGPHGHHLFADSENNGPVGRALVEELIPALEAKYGLIPERTARLLRGHSSGGWSSVWLAITYPETFGAAWSTAPDPVDFRRFQLVDIYGQENMYFVSPHEVVMRRPDPANPFEPNGADLSRFEADDATSPAAPDLEAIASFREGGRVRMTIEQENLMEEVLGPNNTSAQQWDSWQAVFGPRDEAGRPAALYDAVSGVIDRKTAERYRAYDIAERVRQDPGLAGLFHQRIRVYVGDADSFYLNEAVELLRREVEGVQFLHFPEGQHGFVKVLPGHDHGSVLGDPEARGIPADMLAHLRRNGH